MESGEAKRGVFLIDGEDIPFPELAEGFDMDEAMIFFEYTGFPIEDLMVDTEELDPEEVKAVEMKMRGPKTVAALMHLGYRRVHPKAAASNIRKLIGQTNFVDALKGLALPVEGDASPPEMTTSPTTSDESSPASSASSGDVSTSDSEPPADDQEPTTTTRSATSSISPPINSAA